MVNTLCSMDIRLGESYLHKNVDIVDYMDKVDIFAGIVHYTKTHQKCPFDCVSD